MAILKKKGCLADLAARLERTREHLVTLDAAIAQAAAHRAEAISALAEQDLDVVTLTERRSEIGAAEAGLLKQKEALSESISELERRCADLAVGEAEAVVAERRRALVPLAEERDRIELRLTAIAVEEADVEEQIADALDDLKWAAAPYDPEAAARMAAARVQERERLVWLATVANRSQIELELEREPPRFRRLVEAAIAEVDAERGERRQKLAEDSEANLAAVGITVDVDPNAVQPGHAFPRIP